MTPDLLDQANVLAALDPRRPNQVNLRRAVSATYYAVFHLLIDEALRAFIGVPSQNVALSAALARCFKHTEMLKAAEDFAKPTPSKRIRRRLGSTPIDPRVQKLAELFRLLQERRHQADYERDVIFTRTEVLTLISRTRRVVDEVEQFRNESSFLLFLLACLVYERLKAE